MKNKERYQRTFSAVHTSTDYYAEVLKMNKTHKKYYLPKALVACLIIILLLGAVTTAYAVDIGGIQRIVQIWLHGDQTDAVLDIQEDGSYNLSWQDDNGNVKEEGGGGVSFGTDGKEHPLTEEEIIEHLNMPDVSYKDDGTVWVYYYNQALDITNKFNNGVCYVKLIHDHEDLFLTVKYGGGYSFSPKQYISADSFT